MVDFRCVAYDGSSYSTPYIDESNTMIEKGISPSQANIPDDIKNKIEAHQLEKAL